MNHRILRADIREQVGVSLNASSLTMSGRSAAAETPLQRVGALGLAALHVQHGADRLGVPVAMVVSRPEHRPDPENVLAAELASNLWHITFAGQHQAVPRAVALFAAWVAYRPRIQQHFERHPAPDGVDLDSILRVFASLALNEWLSDRCVACGGSGKLERSRTGSWVRPRGSMQRNAIFRVCPACRGSRRQTPSHGARARALDLTHAEYERQRWDAHFTAARVWLNSEIMRLKRPLTVQLERSKKRE